MPLYLGSFTSIDSISPSPGGHKTEETGPGSQVEDGATSSPLSHRCRDPSLEPGIWEKLWAQMSPLSHSLEPAVSLRVVQHWEVPAGKEGGS